MTHTSQDKTKRHDGLQMRRDFTQRRDELRRKLNSTERSHSTRRDRHQAAARHGMTRHLDTAARLDRTRQDIIQRWDKTNLGDTERSGNT